MAFCKVTHADGTESVISGAIGQYIFTAADEPPAHTLEANGAAVSRTTYAKLFAVLGTLYGSGDGSTTFNLPDMRGRFIRGTGGNAAALGTAQAEGLPNLSGSIGQIWQRSYSVNSGVFSNSTVINDNYDVLSNAGDADDRMWLNFNATLSNNIYGASSHVTPINNSATCCIVYE